MSKLKLACIMMFCMLTLPAHSDDGGIPNAELVFTDHIVNANLYGSMVAKDAFVDGSLASREYVFESYKGKEVKIKLNPSYASAEITTPSERLSFTRTSSNSIRVYNYSTGQLKTFSGSPSSSVTTVNDISRSNAWFNQFVDYYNYTKNSSYMNSFNMAMPDGLPPNDPVCGTERDSCGAFDFIGFAGTLVVSAYFCGQTLGVACGASALALGFAIENIVEDCECLPLEEPEDPEEPSPPYSPGETCTNNTCSNWSGLGASGSINGVFHCVAWRQTYVMGAPQYRLCTRYEFLSTP